MRDVRVEGSFMEYASVESRDWENNSACRKFTFSCQQPAEVGTNPDGSVWIKFIGRWEMEEVAAFLRYVL
jgi:hypothetical protein